MLLSNEKSKKAQRRRRKDSGVEKLQGLGWCSTKFFGSSDGDDLRGGKREVDRRKQRRPAIIGEKKKEVFCVNLLFRSRLRSFWRARKIEIQLRRSSELQVLVAGAIFRDGGFFGEIRRRSLRRTRRRPARYPAASAKFADGFQQRGSGSIWVFFD
ncbi:hypothetical protein U1Q18_046745 [Sarracenia purpurea var. burkii]